MATTADRVRGELSTRPRSSATHQAYQLLHVAFVVAPTITGLDKFFHVLVNWDQYLAPPVARLVGGGHGFMLFVGVVEMVVGLIVAVRPRAGSYIVAAWLAGIIINLLILGNYYDIALRDLGLMLGALALGRLATVEPAARARSI